MSKLSKETMSKGIWAYIFFIITIEPAAFQNFSFTNKIYNYAQLIMLIVCAYFFFSFSTLRDLKNKKVCIFMIIYYAYFLFITYLNHGITKTLGIQAMHFIGFALYLDIVINNNPKEIFKSALNILTFFLILNCFIVYIMPNGLYKTDYFENNYLLGYDNQNINFILPALVLVLLKNQYYKKCKMQIIIVYVAAWLTAIKIWSGMTLVMVTMLTIVAVLGIRRNSGFFQKYIFNGKIFNFFNLLIIDLFANIALVIFRLQYYLSFIIEDLLHKDLTFTSRTLIWDTTLYYIRQRPIFGYGKEESRYRALKYGASSDSPFGLHAHNRLLETLYSGGLVMFLFFIFIMFYAALKLMKYKNTIFAKVLSMGIFIYLIGMVTEYYDYCMFFWGFLIIAENASCYCE